MTKDDLNADYRFLDTRLDRFYEWLIDTFAERNFSASGTQNLLRLLLFESHLGVNEPSRDQTFREMLKCITALDNRIVLETVERALNYFEANPKGSFSDQIPQMLKEHHRRQDLMIRRDLALLMKQDLVSDHRLHLTR